MTKKVYGYVLINKETGELAHTKSKVFETRNAAGAGFYQWTRKSYSCVPESVKNKKLSEQNVYEVKELVIADA